MAVITRFNPSATGALHLGHLYTMLVNERFARQSGGKFYIRFDDTSQAIYIESKNPERVPDIIEGQIRDIKWLGIEPDKWIKQSDVQKEVRTLMKKWWCTNNLSPRSDPYPHPMPISIRFGNMWLPYPYTPYQTAERVILDASIGVTHLIRGDDFFLEYSLYSYFCHMLAFKNPTHILLPRLTSKFGDISKTIGGYTIAEFREYGYTRSDIMKLIEDACLIYPPNGWNLWNLKKEPKINL